MLIFTQWAACLIRPTINALFLKTKQGSEE